MQPWFKYYIKELRNEEYFETEYGFFTYTFIQHSKFKEMYIADFYVLPEFRDTRNSQKLNTFIEGIAKRNKCDFISGKVTTTNNNPERAITQMARNMKLAYVNNTEIWFKRDLSPDIPEELPIDK